jgi:outer membrane protein
MKKLIKTLSTVGAFAIAATFAQAQPAPNILVVDMAKLFEGHYKYVDEKAKLEGQQQKAQTELDQMQKDRNALVEQFKALDDQTKNPALSTDAKAAAQGDAQKKYNDIQNANVQMQQFTSDVQRSLQSQMQNFHDMLMDEISKIATDIAKRKGATLLLDKTGRSMIGSQLVVFSDSAYDITDEVAAEIAKNRPATPPPPAVLAPGQTGDSSAPAPTITVPNVTPPSGN